MIQATVDRLGELVPPERVLIVTNAQLVDEIWNQLPQLPPHGDHRRAVPARHGPVHRPGGAGDRARRSRGDHGRDAGGPRDLARRRLSRGDRRWRPSWSQSRPSGSSRSAFGRPIRPNRSATSSAARPLEPRGRLSFPRLSRASSFARSPRPRSARQYLAAGTFYWNSGIFVWKAATILEALEAAAARDVRASDDDRRRDGQPAITRKCLRASSPPSRACRSTMP